MRQKLFRFNDDHDDLTVFAPVSHILYVTPYLVPPTSPKNRVENDSYYKMMTRIWSHRCSDRQDKTRQDKTVPVVHNTAQSHNHGSTVHGSARMTAALLPSNF